MVAKRLLPSLSGVTGLLTFLSLTACQQPPAETGAHPVRKTEMVNGQRVNVDENLQETSAKDRDAVSEGSNDIKKSTKNTVFTPSEQQSGK